MEVWNRGAMRVVADCTDSFGLQNLQTVVSGGRYVAPDGGGVRKCRADKLFIKSEFIVSG